jgi:hypothetical protein
MDNFIVANYLDDYNELLIEPLKAKRFWMDNLPEKIAYRCIPINVANQYGWQVLSPIEFCANWNGGNLSEDIQVHYHDNCKSNFASSHFGSGILSIVPDFILKTNEDISIYVRGIPNMFMDGIHPIEGVVETDWLPFTFTFNYQFTKPGEIIFKKNQPLFSFFPIKRGFIESFKTNKDFIVNNNDLNEEYIAYKDARINYQKNNNLNGQKFYSKTKTPTKKHNIKTHQKQIPLDNF